MSKINFKIKNVKLAFVLLIVAAFIVLILYNVFVFSGLNKKNAFTNQMLEIASENENPIFNVQRISTYSSANAFNEEDNRSLQNMSISQFSDIAIYLDNSLSSSDMTAENTISELYIDNINISTASDKGTKILNYKNSLDFGKYKDLSNADRIDFKVVRSNEENENNNYDEPTFYTDCSNPITLGFLNKNIVTDYSVSSDANSVSFNGKVLQEAGVSLDDINYTLSFTIHIVNNVGQKFAYNMKLNVNLDDENGGIFNGYTNTTNTTSGDEFKFFRELNQFLYIEID